MSDKGQPPGYPTSVGEFITDLDGGQFERKLGLILSDVAGAVIDHNKKGNITITLDLSRFENTYQVVVAHKLSYKRPTARGDSSENELTSTPMHVNTGGRMSLFPESQVPKGQQHMFKGDGSAMTDDNQTEG